MSEEIIDKEQLLEAFNNLGVDNVDEMLLSRIYEKLNDLEFVTTQSLVEIIQSIQLNQEEYFKCDPGSSWAQEYKMSERQLSMSSVALQHTNINIFSSFETQTTTSREILEYWASLGVDGGESVLKDLGLHNYSHIDLHNVSEMLIEELQSCRQISICPTLSAAVASVLYEIKLVTNANENLQKEKEKIKSDLIKSDQRSSALALEVDEQQEKQDQIVAAKIESLNHELNFKLRDLESQNEIENEKRHRRIQQLERNFECKEEEFKISTKQLENDILSLNHDKQMLEKMVLDLKQQMVDLSERNSFLHSEMEKKHRNQHFLFQESDLDIGNLLKHYDELKDRNDELEFLLFNKNERGRLRKRGRRNSSASKSRKTRSRRQKLGNTQATKRKPSPLQYCSDEASAMESPRGEKLKKSCSSSSQRNLESLQHELSWVSTESSDGAQCVSDANWQETLDGNLMQVEAEEILSEPH